MAIPNSSWEWRRRGAARAKGGDHLTQLIIGQPTHQSARIRVLGANLASRLPAAVLHPHSFGYQFVARMRSGRDLDYSRTSCCSAAMVIRNEALFTLLRERKHFRRPRGTTTAVSG